MDWQEQLLISACYRVHIFDALSKGPMSAQELAVANNYDLRAVKIVLEALRDLGLLHLEDGHYRLTSEARNAFVDGNNPNYTVGSLLHERRLIESWLKLDEAIKTGKSQSSRRTPEELESFIRSMDENASKRAPFVAQALVKLSPHAKTILDLGGGPATYAKIFTDKGLKVTVLDTEAVIKIAKVWLKDYPTVNLVAGDFNETLPEGKYDIILLSNITHIYSPEKNVALFKRAKKALAKDGILAVVDFVRGMSHYAAMFGVNMLVNTAHGGTWTSEQYDLWCREAGFSLTKIINVEGTTQQLLVVKNKMS